MYQIVLGKKAEKDLNGIDERYKPRIVAALFELRNNPQKGKSLKGKLKGLYSFKVYPYRIIYKIYKKRLLIFVIQIGHRQGMY